MVPLQFGQFVISNAADQKLQLVLVEQGQQTVRNQRVKAFQKLQQQKFYFYEQYPNNGHTNNADKRPVP